MKQIEGNEVTLQWNIENDTDKDIFVDGDFQFDWGYGCPPMCFSGGYDEDLIYGDCPDDLKNQPRFRFACLRPRTAFKERIRGRTVETSDVNLYRVISVEKLQPEKGGRLFCTLMTGVLIWEESAKRMVYKDVSAEAVIPFESKEKQKSAPPDESPSAQ